jgi:hypothetical protein
MNRSKLWGFEVSQIVAAFAVLALANVVCNITGIPLLFSWVLGIATLLALRLLSHGQKEGFLELALRFAVEPHIYLGHQERRRGEL